MMKYWLFACALWSAPVVMGANLVVNPGFETGSRVIAPRPTTFADWQGDRVAYTTTENGIVPLEGNRMLRFINGEFVASSSGASQYWQNIDLSFVEADIDAGLVQVTASAYFNRVLGDSETDTAFAVSFRMYSGTPTNRVLLDEVFGGIEADGDPSTWELAIVDHYQIPAGTDFLMLAISANENVFNDTSNPEFDGHYADNVSVLVTVVPEASSLQFLLVASVVGLLVLPRIRTTAS